MSDIWVVCCSRGEVAGESDASESGLISSLKRSRLFCHRPSELSPFQQLALLFCARELPDPALSGDSEWDFPQRGRVLRPAAPPGCLRAAEQGCCPGSLRDRSARFVPTQQSGYSAKFSCLAAAQCPRVTVCVCAALGCLRLRTHTHKTRPAPASRFPLPTPRPAERGAAGQRAGLGGEGVSCGDGPAALRAPRTRDKLARAVGRTRFCLCTRLLTALPTTASGAACCPSCNSRSI